MAGSEQRGVDFARDDLFDGAVCIVTARKTTSPEAVKQVEGFWLRLGCRVEQMTPVVHDRVVAAISHVPHAAAVSLVNATPTEAFASSGRGFLDTSRVASGPANVWADIFMTNRQNVTAGIDRLICELSRLRDTVDRQNQVQLEKLLNRARQRRADLIDDKLKQKELLK